MASESNTEYRFAEALHEFRQGLPEHGQLFILADFLLLTGSAAAPVLLVQATLRRYRGHHPETLQSDD